MKCLAVLILVASILSAQPKPKKLLAIGAVYGYQHDTTSDGLATLWKIGKETGRNGSRG